jgi:hypothetical protein
VLHLLLKQELLLILKLKALLFFLLSELHVLLLVSATQGLVYSSDIAAQLQRNSTFRILQLQVKRLFTRKQQYDDLEIILVHSMVCSRELKLASLVIKIEHWQCFPAFPLPSLLVVL